MPPLTRTAPRAPCITAVLLAVVAVAASAAVGLTAVAACNHNHRRHHDADGDAQLMRRLAAAQHRRYLDAVAGGDAAMLPQWYTDHRTHAHTRLALTAYCSNVTKTCEAVFEDAADLFHELGVPAFVRHAHTADEGLWWPDADHPREAWAPFVQATGRNLPQEFIAKADANGQAVILYYYHKVSAYYAATEPGWLNRDLDNKPIPYPRGLGMCVNSPWHDELVRQVTTVAKMGPAAFYWDEYPQPTDGYWCDYCRAKFRQWSSGKDAPNTTNPADPLVREYLRFQTESVQEHFTGVFDAVNAVNASIAHLVSIYKVPCPSNDNSLFETTDLLRINGATVAKTEYNIASSCQGKAKDPTASAFVDRTLSAFGYTLSRDGTAYPEDAAASVAGLMAPPNASPILQGGHGAVRPPHMWVPHLKSPAQSLCTQAALNTYGAVANPDHTEASIPDFELFNTTYQRAVKLSGALAGTQPMRWVAVLDSEAARNRFLPQQGDAAWDTVVAATVGAFEAFLGPATPVGIVTDYTLDAAFAPMRAAAAPAGAPLLGGVRAVVVPTPQFLSANHTAALHTFESAGGVVMMLNETVGAPSTSWKMAAEREALQAKLVAATTAELGPAPVALSRPASDTGATVHAVAFVYPGDATKELVMVTNEFGWCAPKPDGPTGHQPPPARGYGITLSGLAAGENVGDAAAAVTATDAVTGVALNVTAGAKARDYSVALPPFQEVVAAVVSCGAAACRRVPTSQ